MSDSPQTIDQCVCKSCGGKLRVYQPDGHHPTIYCPGCESPWGVHCRDAREEDIADLLEWFAGDSP